MAERDLWTHGFPITVPGMGKTAINTTEWISFANSGTQVLVIDTVAGDLALSILLPSGMWRLRATAVYSTTTVTSIVGYSQ